MSGQVLPFPHPPAPQAVPKSDEKKTPALKDWPASEKPRERLLKLGADALSDAELLALLLRTGEGSGKANAVEQARNLLLFFGSLTKLFQASASELCKTPGIGPAKACGIAAAFALAARARKEASVPPKAISHSGEVFHIFSRLQTRRAEEFWVLLLNTKNHVLREVQVSLGSLSTAPVHPREVFGAAVREGAAAVIFVHNHPSGDPTPSEQDRALTRRLQDAAQLLGIRVLDHVVIGRERHESFADRGWL